MSGQQTVRPVPCAAQNILIFADVSRPLFSITMDSFKPLNCTTTKAFRDLLVSRDPPNDQLIHQFMYMGSHVNKTCTACGRELPAGDFSPDRRNKAGLQARCKECCKAWQRQYRAEHAEVARATDKRRNGTEKRLAASRAEYSKHRDHKLAQKQEYKAKYPERVRANAQKQRARRKNAPGEYTGDELKALRLSQCDKCWWCGKELKGEGEPDHRVPLSRGGTNDIGNIVLACFKCNRNKYNKMPYEWMGRLL